MKFINRTQILNTNIRFQIWVFIMAAFLPPSKSYFHMCNLFHNYNSIVEIRISGTLGRGIKLGMLSLDLTSDPNQGL